MRKLAGGTLVWILAATVVLSACSGNNNDDKDDHVFKTQERALNKAKQLQQQLDESAEERKKQVDEIMR